jgi:hypothetical protein
MKNRRALTDLMATALRSVRVMLFFVTIVFYNLDIDLTARIRVSRAEKSQIFLTIRFRES